MRDEPQGVSGISDDARENLAHLDRTALLLSEQITKFAAKHAGNMILGIPLQSGSVNEMASIADDCKMLIEGVELLKRKVVP